MTEHRLSDPESQRRLDRLVERLRVLVHQAILRGRGAEVQLCVVIEHGGRLSRASRIQPPAEFADDSPPP